MATSGLLTRRTSQTRTLTSKVHETDWVAVLGGSMQYTDEQVIAAFQIGREIGRQGKHLVTGGTTGVPYAAALGAQHGGGQVLGISPASSSAEHVLKYGKPLDSVDVMVFTGMSVEGRGPLILRSALSAIFVGGELGTLQEFAAAYMCGNKVLGVLEGAGGISDHLRTLLGQIETNWGNIVVFDTDPIQLVQKVCREVDGLAVTHPLKDRSEQAGCAVRRIIDAFLSTQRSIDE